MNLSRKLVIGAALTSLLLGGCTSKVTDKAQYSGYLSNYNNLQEVTTTSGEKAMRWVIPSWNPNAYDTVVFKGLELYPQPKPNERVNQQTLNDIQSYMTRQANGVLGQKYRVVSSPAAACTKCRRPDRPAQRTSSAGASSYRRFSARCWPGASRGSAGASARSMTASRVFTAGSVTTRWRVRKYAKDSRDRSVAGLADLPELVVVGLERGP